MNTLPDNVLLAIFKFFLDEYSYTYERDEQERENAWQSLVHVCRRWRCIAFGSPRHLDLELVCTSRTRARDTLDVWPALPLVILCQGNYPIRNTDDIIAVLERRDRVRRIDLRDFQSSVPEIILPEMRQPFPELTSLLLFMDKGTVPIFPESFLGGSAPRLEYLRLHHIPFPCLPKVLLSATHLHSLHLYDIPHSGYILPDALVTILSNLTSLKSFILAFQSPRSCPDLSNRPPPPSSRSVLPVLTIFEFKGVCEYLEYFVDLIDTPQLDTSSITFFNDVLFDTPQFMQFIARTSTLRALEKAHITLWDKGADVNFLSRTSEHMDLKLRLEVLCRGLDWQVSSVGQVCASCLPPLSMSEDLYIYERKNWGLDWKENIEYGLWVDLLHPFTAVKNLYLCREFSRRIGPALQELVEGITTEVLPTLENIFLEGLVPSGSVEGGIGQFVAARQVAGHPITISRWANSENEMIFPYYRYL